MFLRVLLKQHAISPSLSQLQPTLLATILIKSVCSDLAPYLHHFLNSVRQADPIPPSRWSSWVWGKSTVCPLVYPLMSQRTDQTLHLSFPIDARIESPPELWLFPQKASQGFIWRIVGLGSSYVFRIDLLAVLCWTTTVWTEQSSCLNDLAVLCTIIHLTGGSQCPAEGLHLLWPLAVHSDKGTSMEYFGDLQHHVYWCIRLHIDFEHLFIVKRRRSAMLGY